MKIYDVASTRVFDFLRIMELTSALIVQNDRSSLGTERFIIWFQISIMQDIHTFLYLTVS
jgi:hypothetical protein